MSSPDIWTPHSHQRQHDREMREVGAGLVRAFQERGVTAADLAKAARRGKDGQTITDLSQLAQMIPGNNDAMGAPFATVDDPGNPMFSAAGMGPGAPARPFPIGGEPRQFQYRTGFNFPTPPDSDRGVSADLLRVLADQYDLLRQCIELGKDEIVALEWDIVPREKNRKKREQMLTDEADEITRLKQFFEWPEAYMAKDRKGVWKRRGVTQWQQWIGALLEDYFVGDWLTIWPRIMNNGDVLGFERVDGSTLKPLLTTEGRFPTPPYPGLQQYLYGVPRKSFTVEEIYYRPRVVRNHTVYGFSHVEQMLLIVNLALRYQIWLSSGYTDGAIPIGFLEFPENWTKDQIADVVSELNAATSGLSDSRQQWHGLPAGTKWNEMRPFSFDDQFATWLIEYVTAMFGFSAQKLGFMPARGGAGLGGSGFAHQDAQNNDSSEKIPTARWVEARMNELLDRSLGRPDLEFQFVDLRSQNEKEATETDQTAMFAGFKSWDQLLQERGEDPVGVSQPFVMSPTGVVYTVADIKAMQEGVQRNPAPGLPMTGDEIDAANTPVPAPVIAQNSPVQGERPGGAAVTPPSGGRAPGKPQDEDGSQPVRGSGGPKPKPSPAANDPEPTGGDQPAVPVKPADDDNTRPDPTSKAAAPDVTVAGLVVLADDSGRVLLIQRSNDDKNDPAAGRWEFPGGHLEQNETPIEGAMREWREETGMILPAGDVRGQWQNGIYAGFVYAIPQESDLPLNPDPGNREVKNPDDPGGDMIETAAWWNPDDLPDMPALRDECRSTPWGTIQDATPASAKKTVGTTFLFDTGSGMQPHGLSGAARDDLRRWRRKATRDLRDRRPARPFRTDAVPAATKAVIEWGLTKCETAADISALFETAEHPTAAKADSTAQPAVAPRKPAVTVGTTDPAPTPPPEGPNERQERTRHHEEAIAAAIATLTALRLHQAEQAGAGFRETAVIDDTQLANLEDQLGQAIRDAYTTGQDYALDQLGSDTTIDTLTNQAATVAAEQARTAARQFVDDWHTQLDNLIGDDLTQQQIVEGLQRFAEWRGQQTAVTEATTAYNGGKLSVFQEGWGGQYDWSTAGDDNVCEDCEDRADSGPYDLDDLDISELHPGCRCEIEMHDPDGTAAERADTASDLDTDEDEDGGAG